MGEDMTALLLAIARENADLRQQLATAQDMLMETAIDAGDLHALIEAVQAERDAWREDALSVRRWPGAMPQSESGRVGSGDLAGWR
ncbi:hypothetical protein [Methylobacterium pseudosasicola]|uniref:Uncharacterized protein n=1 Tax=Methylobacterium pseudosasicola TaxID=582667 RepID=A0A1I4UPK8_9HYPH|nr:hypothetical protein [Methylobacterium pseudosasicola]SFM90914.1 hypothetical protein SAMN05192568_107416 [Methylobacterium pseudosasicola]